MIDDAEIQTYETDLPALDDLRLGDGVRLDAAITALPDVLAAIKGGYPLKVSASRCSSSRSRSRPRRAITSWNDKLAEIVAGDARGRHPAPAVGEVVRRRSDPVQTQ